MFIWILLGLFCISFFLSLYSLWKDMKKNIKTQHVTEELSKGRVIFHAPTASEADMHTDIDTPEKETSEPILDKVPETPSIPLQDHTGLPVLPMPIPVTEETIHVKPIPVQTHEEHTKEDMLKEEPQTHETQIS